MTTETDTFEHGIGVLGHGNKQTDDIQVSDPISVSGVLIPEDTIVQGGQGVRHFYDQSALQMAERVITEQLAEETVHIVKNFHDIEGQAPADDIIGELTGVRYSEGIGLLFEGEVTDRDIAEKVANGYLSVSPSIARALGEYDPDRDARPVADVAGLRDAAIVGRGQPGARVELGSHPAVGTLARDALSRAFDAPVDGLSVSEPEFSGYSETAWDAPTLEGTFGGDMDAARNSATWIDGEGETFEDLSLFVLNGDGELNVNALDSAWRLASQTDGAAEEDVARLRALYEDLAVTANDAGAITDEEFDSVWQDRIAEEMDANADTDADTDTDPAVGSQTATSGDDGPADAGTQSTDGPESTATNPPTTMSKDSLTDEEQALLAAVDDPSEAIDVLQDYNSREEPTITEQTELDSLEATIGEAKAAFAALLAEDSPMSADALARSDMDALTEPFRDEDGDIDVDTLRQVPETGTTGGDDPTDPADDGPTDLETLSLAEREDIQQQARKAKSMRNRGMDNRASAIEAEVCDTLGYDDYDDIDLEVL